MTIATSTSNSNDNKTNRCRLCVPPQPCVRVMRNRQSMCEVACVVYVCVCVRIGWTCAYVYA